MTLIRSILILLALILVSCGRSPGADVSVRQENDSDGAELRLAALSPGIAVMIRDLGYEDRIIAKHDYDMVLSDQVPAAGSELGFDLEVLIRTRPTHVFFQKTSAERSSKLLKIAQDRGWKISERPLNTLDDIAIAMDDLYYFFQGEPQSHPEDFGVMQIPDHSPPSERLAISWDDLGPVASKAGRMLILGSVDPIGAMAPGSYHYQIIQRLGITPAISDGEMWVELDYEDLISLNPDSIILIAPCQPTDEDRFGVPAKPTIEEIRELFGPIADLPISAIEHSRIGVIDHPLGLLPSGALGEVAKEIGELIRGWDQ